MSVLVLKNIAAEGPGTIEDFLRGNGIPYRVVELGRETIPDTKDFDALVMMGGPMSVNEEDIYPYLNREFELTREFIAQGKKVFGVCLGAQIMAKALGAKVYVGPQKEIGWYDIALTGEGADDPMMRKLAEKTTGGGFSKTVKVFQWHGETFDTPEGATRLASSELYPNQAFRCADKAYAFQFHIEVRKDMIYEWLKDEPVDMKQLKDQTETLYNNYLWRAMKFYEGFFK